MAVNFSDVSYLKFAELLEVDNIQFWDLVELPEIPILTGDIYHLVERFDRLDTLANFYYGDPVMRWLIAAANNIELEPFGMIVGQSLRIPDPDFARDFILNRGRG